MHKETSVFGSLKPKIDAFLSARRLLMETRIEAKTAFYKALQATYSKAIPELTNKELALRLKHAQDWEVVGLTQEAVSRIKAQRLALDLENLQKPTLKTTKGVN